jgi:DNA-binding HxlR family transcriptional regulator
VKYNSTKDPIRIYNEILGGKWRLLILFQLFAKTQRFKDLNQNIEGITPRMLTKELRMLEKYNLVEKEVYREVPPRVEYSLTDDGVKLYPLIENIIKFGDHFAYLLDENQTEKNEEKFELVDEENMVELPAKKEQISEPIAEKIQAVEEDKIVEKIIPSIPEVIAKPKVQKPKPKVDNTVVQLELF